MYISVKLNYCALHCAEHCPLRCAEHCALGPGVNYIKNCFIAPGINKNSHQYFALGKWQKTVDGIVCMSAFSYRLLNKPCPKIRELCHTELP